MKIVIIGSGNVALAYADLFNALGHTLLQVYSRSSEHAQNLASKYGSETITALCDVNKTANLYIIAVSDDSIDQIVDDLPQALKGIVVHTSGATPLSVLHKFSNSGVIYPIQTITKQSDLKERVTPLGIEGNNEIATALLLEIGKTLSKKSFYCDSHQRLALHVAAVFANNFTNALYQIANDIVKANHLDFELLKPLIQETAEKIKLHTPREVQTGPAKRNDEKTINRHLEFLSQRADWTTIYQELTKLISNKHS